MPNPSTIAYDESEPMFSVRDMKLLLWAAKCHVHHVQGKWDLSQHAHKLPHSAKEIQGAIDRCERDNPGYRVEPASDEGVRSWNKPR
jgi:hypothetical protein